MPIPFQSNFKKNEIEYNIQILHFDFIRYGAFGWIAELIPIYLDANSIPIKL